MRKKTHGTLIAVIIAFALVFGLAGCLGGCAKSTVWEYAMFHTGEGITILSLKDNSILTEENVLTLPIEVDGKKVMDFGRARIWQYPQYFNPGTQVEKIIVPDGVPIGEYFWGENIPLVVEFLSEYPTNIRIHVKQGDVFRTLIVPDGTREAYRSCVRGIGYYVSIVEKSDFLSQNNNEK
ncbi:MAG: hypothetical protein FWH03_04895 [Firmicutes bacterium]|nr:hypothetical protein [Bacillota bacterium]